MVCVHTPFNVLHHSLHFSIQSLEHSFISLAGCPAPSTAIPAWQIAVPIVVVLLAAAVLSIILARLIVFLMVRLVHVIHSVFSSNCILHSQSCYISHIAACHFVSFAVSRIAMSIKSLRRRLKTANLAW